MLLEQVMVTDREHCDAHVPRPQSEVQCEQEEVSMVFKADAIVYPRTVMVHHEGACVTDTAVMGSCRFDLVACHTLLGPEFTQLLHCFTAVP